MKIFNCVVVAILFPVTALASVGSLESVGDPAGTTICHLKGEKQQFTAFKDYVRSDSKCINVLCKLSGLHSITVDYIESSGNGSIELRTGAFVCGPTLRDSNVGP